MGRVSRYKKPKKIDPFGGRGGVEGLRREEELDRVKKERKWQDQKDFQGGQQKTNPLPRRMQLMKKAKDMFKETGKVPGKKDLALAQKEGAKSKKRLKREARLAEIAAKKAKLNGSATASDKTPEGGKEKQSVVGTVNPEDTFEPTKLKIQPGESIAAFNRRVEEAASMRLQSVAMKAAQGSKKTKRQKFMRQKAKEHRKKQQAQRDEDDRDQHATGHDEVTFGDVAERPPELSASDRVEQRRKKAEQKRLERERATAEGRADPELDPARLEAIAAYREKKKFRLERAGLPHYQL
eukprot:Clim_evm35s215 gene=Clim_evmTU35s215